MANLPLSLGMVRPEVLEESKRRAIALGLIDPVKKPASSAKGKRGRLTDITTALDSDLLRPTVSGGLAEGFLRGGEAFLRTRAARDERKRAEEEKRARTATIGEALAAMQGDTLPPGAQGPVRPGSPDRAAAVLAGNPDTAGMGFSLAMAAAQAKQKQAAEAEAEARRLANAKELKREPGWKAPGEGPSYFGSPVYYQKPDGSIGIGQLSSAGGVRPVEMPGQVVRPTVRVGGSMVDPLLAESRADVTPELEAGAAAEEKGKVTGKFEGERPQLQVKARSALDGVNQKFENLSGTIDKAITQSDSGWGTGLFGSMASLVPGTPQHNLAKTLQTVKAISGFETLQAMREASKTGGALGQVSNIEIGLLQSAIANVEQSQTKEQLQENLRNLKVQMQASRDRMRAAYDEQFGSIGKSDGVSRETSEKPNEAAGWSAEEIR